MIDDMAGLYTVIEREEKCSAVQGSRMRAYVQTAKFSDYSTKTPMWLPIADQQTSSRLTGDWHAVIAANDANENTSAYF
jgi:hypothetical protein